MAVLRATHARATGRLLVGAVRGDPVAHLVTPALPASTSWPTLALIHGVEAFLAAALGDDPRVSSDVLAQLRDASYRVALIRAQVLADLVHLDAALADAASDFLVLKGPVLGEHLYPMSALRSYGDLDVLVRPEGLGHAVGALEAAGFAMVDRNWDLVHRQRRGEVHLVAPMGTPIDLHWHLLNKGSLRDTFDVDLEGVFDRSRRVELGVTSVSTLDEVDTLVYVAFHAALHGGARLMWLEDVAMCGTVAGLDWDRVRDRARQWRVVPALALMLARARRTVGLAVPRAAWSSLGEGRRYATLAAPADHAFPVQLDRGRRSVTAMVAKNCRDTSWDSAKELARRSARWAFTDGRRFGEPTRTSRDPSDPASLLYAAGGKAARERFFDEVASGRL